MKRRGSFFDDSETNHKKNRSDESNKYSPKRSFSTPSNASRNHNNNRDKNWPSFRFNKSPSNHSQQKKPKTEATSLAEEDYARITASIIDYFKSHNQTYECYLKKQQLRDALYCIMQETVPYIGVYIIGSSANGFGTNKSDVDMCLMVSNDEIDQKTEALIFLKTLSRSLRKAEFIRHLQVIPAKVPIIKFHDALNRLDCDLNVNSHNGIRNTHLMKYYSEIEWRVKPLVLMVKRWAKFHDINDAAKQTISSYSLALMAIFYLQSVCEPPIAPVLHDLYPGMFHPESDVRTLDLNVQLNEWKSDNKQSLGELFVGFLRYYANFDYKKHVISVRTGKLMQVDNYLSRSHDGAYSQWKHLCIEEPFDLSNTARSVYDQYVFQGIISVFKKSFQMITQAKNLEALFLSSFMEN